MCRLLGNSLLAALSVVHFGMLNRATRKKLCDKWVEELSKRSILTSSQFTLCSFLQEHTISLHQKFWSPSVIANPFLKENLLIMGKELGYCCLLY